MYSNYTNLKEDDMATQHTVIDGFEIPDNAADVRDWYSYAADNAAMYPDDDNSCQARAAYRELHAARQAMDLCGLRHGGPR
jgi:hypothetical protein